VLIVVVIRVALVLVASGVVALPWGAHELVRNTQEQIQPPDVHKAEREQQPDEAVTAAHDVQWLSDAYKVKQLDEAVGDARVDDAERQLVDTEPNPAYQVGHEHDLDDEQPRCALSSPRPWMA